MLLNVTGLTQIIYRFFARAFRLFIFIVQNIIQLINHLLSDPTSKAVEIIHLVILPKPSLFVSSSYSRSLIVYWLRYRASNPPCKPTVIILTSIGSFILYLITCSDPFINHYLLDYLVGYTQLSKASSSDQVLYYKNQLTSLGHLPLPYPVTISLKLIFILKSQTHYIQ